jgi:hypothetical protein
MVPKASESLYAYKQWRKSLEALPEGTILHWLKDYDSIPASNSIKAGQFTKIIHIRKSNGISDLKLQADFCYKLVLCDKNGKEFKRTFYWYVDGIARRLDVDAKEIEIA